MAYFCTFTFQINIVQYIMKLIHMRIQMFQTVHKLIKIRDI